MDIFSKEQRSRVMSRIRSVDTKPEVRLRKALFAHGLRYRKNVRALPGTPDIVFPKHRFAIQVRGCFWHAHEGCGRSSQPSDNAGYWLPKLARNVARDEAADAELRSRGWRLAVVWECEISSNAKLIAVAARLASEIRP